MKTEDDGNGDWLDIVEHPVAATLMIAVVAGAWILMMWDSYEWSVIARVWRRMTML